MYYNNNLLIPSKLLGIKKIKLPHQNVLYIYSFFENNYHY